jgi:hypothetical protein
MEIISENLYTTEYQIVELIRLQLYRRRHGLALVLGEMPVYITEQDGEFRTDGTALYLDAKRLQEEFLRGSEFLCLDFLHMLSHCLLGHPFLARRERKGNVKDWDDACDHEAWALTEQLWGEALKLPKEAETLPVDNHQSWGQIFEAAQRNRATGDVGSGAGTWAGETQSERWWQLQLEILQKECSTGQKRRAGTALRRNSRRLVPAAGHRGDYREILHRLSSFREDSRTNPDEFQYALYEYGMETYGNVPLIEPLEYREERKIEDLVLVIDTSGSCEKELVRIFLEETRSILEQEQLFFRRFCLHIIQCDNQIQRDDKIESREDFEHYLEDLQITGGGGTDFCPAFDRVGELQEAGEFRELKGLLYFTDGCGQYPREAPDYDVYFVMLKDRYDAIDMPDWIHRLVLEET